MKKGIRWFLCGLGLFVSSACGSFAAVIAIEDFDYRGTDLAGKDGGTGWSGSWSGTGSFTLADNGESLRYPGRSSAGNRVGRITTGNAVRRISNPLNLNKGTYYLGVLLTKSKAASVDLAFSDGSSDRWRMRWNASDMISFGVSSSTDVSAGNYSSGETWLVVMKFDATAGTDTISMKVFKDGDEIAEPESWDAVTTGSTGITANHFKISGNVAGGQIDSIRIGTGFEDAVPPPAAD